MKKRLVAPWQVYASFDWARMIIGERIGLAGVMNNVRVSGSKETPWVGTIFWDTPRVDPHTRKFFASEKQAKDWVDSELESSGNFILIDKSKLGPLL